MSRKMRLTPQAGLRKFERRRQQEFPCRKDLRQNVQIQRCVGSVGDVFVIVISSLQICFEDVASTTLGCVVYSSDTEKKNALSRRKAVWQSYGGELEEQDTTSHFPRRTWNERDTKVTKPGPTRSVCAGDDVQVNADVGRTLFVLRKLRSASTCSIPTRM